MGHQRIASPLARARVRNMGTARARRRHAAERGHVAPRQPSQAGGNQNTGGTAEAVHPVFNRSLPQPLPEASSGVSLSHSEDYRWTVQSLSKDRGELSRS